MAIVACKRLLQVIDDAFTDTKELDAVGPASEGEVVPLPISFTIVNVLGSHHGVINAGWVGYG